MFETVGDYGESKVICDVILLLCLDLIMYCAVSGCGYTGAMGWWFSEVRLNVTVHAFVTYCYYL